MSTVKTIKGKNFCWVCGKIMTTYTKIAMDSRGNTNPISMTVAHPKCAQKL